MKYDPCLHNRRSIRLHNWDYAGIGIYFVTICCKNRLHLFGKIANGKMLLNDFGKIAHDEWGKTTEIRTNVKLHEFIVMPNHVHGIVEINVKCVCNTPLRQQFTNTLQSPSNTIGAIIRGYKSAVTKQCCRGVLHTPLIPNVPTTPNSIASNSPIESIWQRNYHEHIIRNETEFARITNYIRNNPIFWKNDYFNTLRRK